MLLTYTTCKYKKIFFFSYRRQISLSKCLDIYFLLWRWNSACFGFLSIHSSVVIPFKVYLKLNKKKVVYRKKKNINTGTLEAKNECYTQCYMTHKTLTTTILWVRAWFMPKNDYCVEEKMIPYSEEISCLKYSHKKVEPFFYLFYIYFFL